MAEDACAAGRPWVADAWIVRTQSLLDSFACRLGRELIDRHGSPLEQSLRLYEAPFVVVAHGTEADPILNYANQAALVLWAIDLPTLLRMPSRLTAEPVHREERARMLAQTRARGYIDDYQGIRITADGRRFRIREAIVWNVLDEAGGGTGQAATFSRWEWLQAD